MAVVTQRRWPRVRPRALADAYVEHDLLTFASAISFQILSSLVPFLLFAFGLLGFLQLEDVWRAELAPQIESSLSPSAFGFIDEAIGVALTNKQLFWLTAGFVIALWEVSGAVRAVMGALNRVYRDETRRSWGRRMVVSTGLALVLGVCLLAAVAIVVLAPLLYGDVGGLAAAGLFLARWGLAGAFVLLGVGALLHYAPERHQPLRWVSFGTVLVVVGWMLMSIGFGTYLRSVADYNSIFGALATIVVLIAYLYAAAVVFLGGVQIDALVREERAR